MNAQLEQLPPPRPLHKILKPIPPNVARFAPYVVAGLSNQQIADHFGLHISTVKNGLITLRYHCGVLGTNRTEFALYLRKIGVKSPEETPVLNSDSDATSISLPNSRPDQANSTQGRG